MGKFKIGNPAPASLPTAPPIVKEEPEMDIKSIMEYVIETHQDLFKKLDALEAREPQVIVEKHVTTVVEKQQDIIKPIEKAKDNPETLRRLDDLESLIDLHQTHLDLLDADLEKLEKRPSEKMITQRVLVEKRHSWLVYTSLGITILLSLITLLK
jgi:hypothetical protein